MNISEVLNRIRREHGLNESQLARAIPCSKTTLFRLRKGERELGHDLARRIDKVFPEADIFNLLKG